MIRRQDIRRAAALGLLAAATAAVPAHAASRLVIRGAGYGHGVGMSQYGAYGFARNGSDYRFILQHYFTGTSLDRLGSAREVRVILQSPGRASFAGATRAGTRSLRAERTYSVARAGGDSVTLLSPRGRRLGTYPAPLRVTGPRLVLRGRAANGVADGSYRGALEFRAGRFSGVDAINALPVDDYVRGVVPAEMPPSWDLEALKAQAVAARTYAITTNAGGAGFEQYPDTRSQVYRGVIAERPSTDAAVAATAGEVVTYQGRPVVTFFFSTSGGRTENVEFGFAGSRPNPWLQSVDDPFDDLSPRHRWGPYRLTASQAAAKLGGLVKGRFRGIKVLERGRSPRIVDAEILGTRGRTAVTGPQLRARFGLFDTWAYFTTISTSAAPPPIPEPDPAPEPAAPELPAGGATAPQLRARAAAATMLTGRFQPGRAGALVHVERSAGQRWVPVGTTRLERGGRYAAAVGRRGVYRVRWGSLAGPGVRVR